MPTEKLSMPTSIPKMKEEVEKELTPREVLKRMQGLKDVSDDFKKYTRTQETGIERSKDFNTRYGSERISVNKGGTIYDIDFGFIHGQLKIEVRDRKKYGALASFRPKGLKEGEVMGLYITWSSDGKRADMSLTTADVSGEEKPGHLVLLSSVEIDSKGGPVVESGAVLFKQLDRFLPHVLKRLEQNKQWTQ